MRLKEFRQKSFKTEFSLLIVSWYKVNLDDILSIGKARNELLLKKGQYIVLGQYII